MLRVTIELYPGGRQQGRRTLATADVGRVKSGQPCTYAVGRASGIVKVRGAANRGKLRRI